MIELRSLRALVRKDLLIFFGDCRAVAVSLGAPIVLAAFIGYVFGGAQRDEGGGPGGVTVRIVDEDRSALSEKIVARLRAEPMLEAGETGAADEAREAVRAGRAAVAVILPKGFGAASGRALFFAAEKPALDFLYDPSRGPELMMVRGLVTQHVMEIVSQEMFGGGATGRETVRDALERIDGASGIAPDDRVALKHMLESVSTWYARAGPARASAPAADPTATAEPARSRGLSLPYEPHEEAIAARRGIVYNSYAHAFAGMGVQWVLFAAIEAGVAILNERQRGFWRRLRAAPLSRTTLLAAKATSCTILSLVTLLTMFGFGAVVFHIRVEGSLPGFLLVCAACSAMGAAFGLFLAAIGGSPEATKGVATFAMLVLVMLGGAWFPSFLFPAWLQKVTLAMPTRWAVDGLESQSWRGLPFGSALAPAAVLFGSAALFGALAIACFRWERD
jgi:ABC-2 type transport system permease protein